MDPLIVLSLVSFGIPLVTFVLLIFNQRPLSERAHLIAIPGIAFSCALALYIAWVRLHDPSAPALSWSIDWIGPFVGNLPTIRLNVVLDNITVILMAVITGVSFLVHLYSIAYMRRDRRYARYFAFLGLFTFAMMGIVLSANFLQLYVFWELVGFSSYILIAHWYEGIGPQAASFKAFITNRIGDALMWSGILLLFSQFHTFDLREIFGDINQGLPLSFSLFGLAPEQTLTVCGLLLFCGAVAKSAQFPLHVWLPDAMEGPTPVSALIHAATMVAAGVYLLARIFPMLTAKAMLVIACTGAFTSVLAATIAITQRDIKKVLAYSTISQLGLMVMSIGSGAVAAGMFHLVTHAAFKACLFLSAGSVIKAMHRAMDEVGDHETNDHDILSMGGFFKKMPITGWCFLIATLAITGLPLTAGFLSKGEILSSSMAYGDLQRGIAEAIPWVGFGVTLLTAFYMWREVILVFFGVPAKPQLYEKIRESSKMITIPLVVLAAMTFWFWYGIDPIDASSGWFLKKWVQTPAQAVPPQSAPQFRPKNYFAPVGPSESFPVGISTQNGYNPSAILPNQVALEEERSQIAPISELIAILSAIGGFIIAFVLFQLRPQWSFWLKTRVRPLYLFSYRGWFWDELYGLAVAKPVVILSRAVGWFDHRILDGAVNLAGKLTVLFARIVAAFDKYVIDGIVNLTGAIVQFFGLMARSVQTGRIQTYLSWVVATIVVLLVLLRFSLLHF